MSNQKYFLNQTENSLLKLITFYLENFLLYDFFEDAEYDFYLKQNVHKKIQSEGFYRKFYRNDFIFH